CRPPSERPVFGCKLRSDAEGQESPQGHHGNDAQEAAAPEPRHRPACAERQLLWLDMLEQAIGIADDAGPHGLRKHQPEEIIERDGRLRRERTALERPYLEQGMLERLVHSAPLDEKASNPGYDSDEEAGDETGEGCGKAV